MSSYGKSELREIIDLHRRWLHDEEGGRRADLRGADLIGGDE